MGMFSNAWRRADPLILIFDNGYFSEFGTFSISDWIGHAPPQLLSKNFGLPASAFASFPKEEVYFARGQRPSASQQPNLQGREEATANAQVPNVGRTSTLRPQGWPRVAR